MRLPDILGTTAFRWALAVAGAFAAASLLLFAFVYWQTAGFERAQLDEQVLRESQRVIAGPPEAAVGRVTAWIQEDLHSVRYALLVDATGRPEAGNLKAMPSKLLFDGHPREVRTRAPDNDGDADERREIIRAVGSRLADGRALVVGHDIDELEHVQAIILRALGLGLLPMVAMALAGGALLGRRALARVAAFDDAIGHIQQGRLGGRLPVTGNGDEFDRLAAQVNAMLDEIETLVDEVRGVGDSIAHDLRTPLTRARTRLERCRDTVRTPAGFAAAIDEALTWLDQTFAIITAILRIGEIERGRRRSAFEQVALAPLMREAAELYDPVADEQRVLLGVEIEAEAATALGDRDLIFEAIVNLLDNALKFTPPHGHVTLSLTANASEAVMAVSDDGPGIAPADRDHVVKRFYRAERSRHLDGSGLGLSLVSVIAKLHGFRFTIGDNHPGLHVELRCPPVPGRLDRAAAEPAGAG